jgi:hypothetical protein
MHYELGVEGEREQEDHSRKKLKKIVKINGEDLCNLLFSRYYGYPMKVIETCCPLSHTRNVRNAIAYSIVQFTENPTRCNIVSNFY